jgi:hypothetical protein
MAEREEPQSLADFGDRFRNLQGLLFVSSILDQGSGALAIQMSAQGTVLGPPPPALLQAQQAASAFRVVRVRYESPLEVMLEYGPYGGGVAALYPVALKMLNLWDRFNQSRRRQSNTQVQIWKNKVEIAKAQAELLTIVRQVLTAPQTLAPQAETGLEVQLPPVPMSQATEALLDISTIELQGDLWSDH